jgi:hypothetical protein
MVVMPQTSLAVAVRFADPPAGGPSGGAPLAADLVIDTDDPQWEAAGGKLVTVSASTPCNPLPVAEVNAPASAAAGGRVTLDASGSFDWKPDAQASCQPGLKCTATSPAAGCPAQPITAFEWELLSVPTNAGGTVALAPQGRSSSPTATLDVGSCAPCSYVVRVSVFDDTPGGGRRSNFTDVTINVP